ncbi:hypothetical protein [Streptomyces sp. enrichment culture]|uniref:hypothetical protein n=1 Tax=Streptomyces sp. enrichment culture TaxID=1795815 RepID=UPI003F560A7F
MQKAYSALKPFDVILDERGFPSVVLKVEPQDHHMVWLTVEFLEGGNSSESYAPGPVNVEVAELERQEVTFKFHAGDNGSWFSAAGSEKRYQVPKDRVLVELETGGTYTLNTYEDVPVTVTSA